MIGVFFSCFSSVQSIPPEWNSATWPNQTALTAEHHWHDDTGAHHPKQVSRMRGASTVHPVRICHGEPWLLDRLWLHPAGLRGPSQPRSCSHLHAAARTCCPPGTSTRGLWQAACLSLEWCFNQAEAFLVEKKYLLFPLRKFHSDPVNYYLNLTMFGGIFSLRIASWPQILCLDCTQKSSS